MTSSPNRLHDLGRQARAARRWSPRGTLSLDAPVGENGDALSTVLEGGWHDPAVAVLQAEFVSHLERLRARLSTQQQVVLDALSEDDVPKAELARGLGLRRSALYAEIRRIRAACRDSGLSDLLAP